MTLNLYKIASKWGKVRQFQSNPLFNQLKSLIEIRNLFFKSELAERAA